MNAQKNIQKPLGPQQFKVHKHGIRSQSVKIKYNYFYFAFHPERTSDTCNSNVFKTPLSLAKRTIIYRHAINYVRYNGVDYQSFFRRPFQIVHILYDSGKLPFPTHTHTRVHIHTHAYARTHAYHTHIKNTYIIWLKTIISKLKLLQPQTVVKTRVYKTLDDDRLKTLKT